MQLDCHHPHSQKEENKKERGGKRRGKT